MKRSHKRYIRKGSLLAKPGRGEIDLEHGIASLGLVYERQVPIGPYYVDFLIKKYSIVIEVDGPNHLQPEVAEKDHRRDDWLRRRGYRVVRVNSERAHVNPRGVAPAALKSVLSDEEWSRYKEWREADIRLILSY